MRKRHYEDPDGRMTILPAIIQPKNSSMSNCIVPPCQLFLYEVGDFVSTDQFICKTPGRLPTGYGRESQDRCFQGGTIYNDAASGLIWVENQVSLGANERSWVRHVSNNEQWLWDQCVSEVKHCHGDNGIFSAKEYHRDCD